MSNVLYIESSPRKDRSASIAVANHFLNSYRANHPNDRIEVLDLWQKELPPFDGFALEAKYAIVNGQPHTTAQGAAWNSIVKLAEHFKSFDKYVFSVPMWNFGIPYKLKHYIDLLVQPGLTFSFSPSAGYQGLVTDKPAIVVYARGGAYGPSTGGESYDKQSDYLKHVLGFIGITQVTPIFVEPTLAGPDAKDKAVAVANQQATRLATTF